MQIAERVILHNKSGRTAQLNALVAVWILAGVKYVGVVGDQAFAIEEIIDDLCVGDGTEPYFMVTACHGPDETIEDAVFLASQLLGFKGTVSIVEL